MYKYKYNLLSCSYVYMHAYTYIGVRSHHKNGAEDRKWKVRCCGAKDYHTEDCVLTDYVNMYHGDMDYKIEAQCGGRIGALVGLESSKWKKT